MNCYIFYVVMAKDRPDKPSKGVKRKNGEKDVSPKKKVNNGTVGKNGVKSAKKSAPHTVSKPPPSPNRRYSSLTTRNSERGSVAAAKPVPGMLLRPFPSLSNSDPPTGV